MNCKPGDLAFIKKDIEVPVVCQTPFGLMRVGFDHLKRDTIVKVIKLRPSRNTNFKNIWVLEEPVFTVKLKEAYDALPDEFLTPIGNPGEDEQDETLLWKPVPVTTKEPELV